MAASTVRSARLAIAALGAIASVVIAVSSHYVGAAPFGPGPTGVLVRVITHPPGDPMRYAYFAALLVFAVCWLMIGRQCLTEGGWTGRSLQLVALTWALPMLCAIPLASRDMWAYAGQGNLLAHGIDPYHHGPSAAPGVYAQQVSVHYSASTTPYGPIWAQLGRLVVDVSGPHPFRATYLFRGLVAIGYAATVLCLPRLCRAFSVSTTFAMFLFCLNPLVIVIALGGGHNDLLMIGFVALALWFLVGRGPLLATLVVPSILLAVATSVKLPAIVVLAFVPHLWCTAQAAHRRMTRSTLWVAAVVAALSGVIAGAVIAVLTGLPDGYLVQFNTGVNGASWLSVPVLLVLLGKYLRGGPNDALHTFTGSDQQIMSRLALVLAAVLLSTLWLRARDRNPMPYLATALALVATLSTNIQSWYAVWALFAVALVTLRRGWTIAVCAGSLFLSLALQPDGVNVFLHPLAVALVAVSVLMAWLVLRRSPAVSPAPDPVAAVRGC